MNLKSLEDNLQGAGTYTTISRLVEIVQTIQRAENNIGCFGTSRVGTCQEENCLWRTECLMLSDC